ncbi:MAG TPA: T9SS type A sorting domain-containing protein [Brumimicrobium sp.]|nr:T9SS type A sorting domain-containing protein [Brumimicrobium sp.]
MKKLTLLFTSLFLLSTFSFSQNGSETYTGCEDDGYSVDVNGTTYDESNPTGTETITGGAVDNSDSTVVINLEFLPATTATINVSACNTYTTPSGDSTYTITGTYNDTIPNAANCDSIITINLTIETATSDTVTVSACDSYVSVSGNYTWTTDGVYNDTIPNAVGCDSIIVTNLTILNSTADTITVNACNTYTTPSGDSTYTIAGIYNDTIPNAAGCDSILTINLSIGTIATTDTVTVSACDSYVSVSGNYTWTTDGTYNDTIPNAVGCDSIIVTNLSIVTIASSDTVTVSACDSYVSVSGNYTWTTDGIYNDTILNAIGCDSIIVTNLTILNSTTETISVDACDTYTTPSGDYSYTAAGTYNDTIPNAAGCDSIITINLTMNTSDASTDVQTACFSYTWIDSITYTYSNNTATHTYTNVDGCDSTISLNLTINTFNRHIAVGPDNDILKVTKGFDSYQWVDCDNGFAPISGATDAHFSPSQNGSYAVIMKNNSCTDTSECKTINNAGLSDEDLNYLNIYPNPTSSQVTVSLGNNEKIANVRVFDLAGKEIQNKAINNSAQTNIIIQGNSGFYIIEVTTQSNQVVRRRISKLD